MKRLLFLVALIAFAVACTKETTTIVDLNEPNDPISVVPAIVLDGISSTQVQAYTDSLTFLITYTDGDGDLGNSDADIMDIELVDTRDEETLIFKYHLSPRAPEGASIAITGTLDIVLQNTILLDSNNAQETTTFKIRLRDRAGNWSNVVDTETIVIVN